MTKKEKIAVTLETIDDWNTSKHPTLRYIAEYL